MNSKAEIKRIRHLAETRNNGVYREVGIKNKFSLSYLCNYIWHKPTPITE